MITQFDYTCLNCGKAFKSRNKNRKYCSTRCKYDTMKGQPRHPNSGKKKTKKPTQFICEFCKQPFERMIIPSAKSLPRFCSPTCRNKARKWNGPARHVSSNWKTCPICGNKNWREGDYCQLHRPKGNNPHPIHNPITWTKEMVEFIKNNYSSMGGKEVGKILGLQSTQVINKANRLGLKLDKDASHRIIHSQAKKYMLTNNPMKNEESKQKVLKYWKEHPEEKQANLEKLTIGKQKIQRDKPTKLEQKMFQYLTELGVKFEPYFLIKPKFIVDVLVGDNLIIQADGDYWHGHPRFENLTDRQRKQQIRDKAQDKYLETCGYKVIRIWESDMSKELITRILKENNFITAN